jgi:hypothetical protein
VVAGAGAGARAIPIIRLGITTAVPIGAGATMGDLAITATGGAIVAGAAIVAIEAGTGMATGGANKF